MDFRRWKGSNAAAIMGSLIAGPLVAGIWLAGCGGGGGGSSPTPPAAFAVRGTVFAPGRQLQSVGRVATRQNTLYNPVLAGIVVQVGRVNNAGGGFSSLAQTTTDALGGYTVTLPFGVSAGPTLVARATNGVVVLENIVTGPVCDVSPETTAAVELLFSTAAARGIPVGRLSLAEIDNYLNVALPIEQLGRPQTTATLAVSSALSILQRAPNAQSALNAALANLGPVGTPVPTPLGGGTPLPTVRPTATTGGKPPTPPGGGTPTPRPTATPLPGGTPAVTPLPTQKATPIATPSATKTPAGGSTPSPTTIATVIFHGNSRG